MDEKISNLGLSNLGKQKEKQPKQGDWAVEGWKAALRTEAVAGSEGRRQGQVGVPATSLRNLEPLPNF